MSPSVGSATLAAFVFPAVLLICFCVLFNFFFFFVKNKRSKCKVKQRVSCNTAGIKEKHPGNIKMSHGHLDSEMSACCFSL